MFDWLIEAVAFAGVLLGIAIIAYGGNSLPEIVPTHIGPSGIDSYGSKWQLMGPILVLILVFYGVLTVINHYLYRFYNPQGATDENASAVYHAYQDILRIMKLIYVWMLAIIAIWLVKAMPGNPKLALGSMIFLALALLPSLLVIILVLTYFEAKPGKKQIRNSR